MVLTDLLGLDLLQIALTETNGNYCQDPAFSRHIHIDALSYLLRGLPEDLTEQEAERIRNALPQSVVLHVAQPEPKSTANSSLLHRGLASSVVLACLIIRLLLPYFKYLIAAAYRFEKSHQVSEKVFLFGVSIAKSLGKKSLQVANSTLGNDFVSSSMAYCVDGVRGGLTEGLGKGLKVIEAP